MTVVLFPPARQLGEVRRCAINLNNVHGEHAVKYWRSEMLALAATLASWGVGKREIAREVYLFTIALQEELQRLTWRCMAMVASADNLAQLVLSQAKLPAHAPWS